MNITNTNKYKEIKLCVLNVGDLFELNGVLYMKTDRCVNNNYICIALDDGEYKELNFMYNVYPAKQVNELEYKLIEVDGE